MREVIHTDRSDPTVDCIIRATFPSYNGRTVTLQADTEVHCGNTYWDGGTRHSYAACRLDTFQSVSVPQYDPPQFGGPATLPPIPVPVNGAVVEHSIFCGKDAGIRITVRPEFLAPLLPEKPQLTENQTRVLGLIARLNSKGRKHWRDDNRVSKDAWDAVVLELAEKGLTTPRGAITNEGRNTIQGQERSDYWNIKGLE